jgi:hypothetical protein
MEGIEICENAIRKTKPEEIICVDRRIILKCIFGCTMSQAVTRWLLIAKVWVRAWVSPCGIYGE